MEARVTGKLVEITDVKGKPFGFTLATDHIHEVPCAPAFPGDDHYDWEREGIPLYFSTFEDSLKRLVQHASIGDELTVSFVLRSKKYSAGWVTFMNPLVIENKDAVEGLYSRSEIRGKI
jgi:hypothetical protein